MATRFARAVHPFAANGILQFVGRNAHTIFAWPIAALIIGIIGWSILFDKLEESRQEAELAALQQANAFSKVYADHLVRTVEAIDQVLLHLRFEWRLSNGHLSLEEMKHSDLFLASPLVFASIVDRDGFIVTNTTSDRTKNFAGDRAYFLAQKEAESDRLYIGAPILGRNTKFNVIPFSRKLIDDQGNFAGVAEVAVAPSYLTANYDATIYGQHGFLGVIGKDNIVRVTRTDDLVNPSEHEGMIAAPALTMPGGSRLFEGGRWFRDQRNRYVGWHAIERYPLVALVGLDQQQILSPYAANRAAAIHTAMLATIALAMFTVIGMALSLRLAWRKRQLEMAQATYRMATEEGSEGFYIARPIRDRNEAMVDFEVVDCNHRGAEFFHRRRDELIGARVSSLYEEPVRTRLLRPLRRAEETGFYENDFKVSGGRSATYRWMHVKIVRSNDALAVTMRDVSDAKAHIAELQRRSNEDPLTRLPNRHWIQSYLPHAIERAAAEQTMAALLFVDLDGFKGVNDALGHSAGDELLRYAAQRLKIAVRPQDHVVRWGGDEFVVLIERIDDKDAAAHIATRILQAFEESFRLQRGVRSVGTSIGISIFPTDGSDSDTLLHNADVAMYSVKTSGRGHYRFFEAHFYEALRERLEKEIEIRRAIENDQFVMYYQPRVDIVSGGTASMEALVRWSHPTKGLLGPLEFIPIAEETGLILDLGELIIHKVCIQLSHWARTGQQLVPVSVNVSPRQFHEADIRTILSTALHRHGVDPRLVEIEVTESSMIGEDSEISRVLAALQAMGIRICIDDFGTGYSSLSQLQRLDFDVLKIDRAFTAEVARTDEGSVFVKAIITMAHALGMRVVAEGVETEQQIRVLKALRCDEIQGYYVSRPVPAPEVQPVLPKWFMPSVA